MITIDKTNKYFKEWRFVLAAYDKKHSEFDVIQVGDKITATDGKRLYRAEIEHSFESGYYKVLKNTTSEIQLERFEGEVSKLWKQCGSLFDVIFDRRFSVWRKSPHFTIEIMKTLNKYNIAIDYVYLKSLEQYSTDWLIKFEILQN